MVAARRPPNSRKPETGRTAPPLVSRLHGGVGQAARTEHSETIIVVSAQDKSARGTKRVCQACEVRFYDLARDPIVCPACGARNAAEASRLLELGERAASKASKTSWRSKPFKPAKPVLPVEPDPAPEIVADAQEAPGPSADEDTVLEQEGDEDDVTEWIDRDGAEPRDT